MPSKKNAPGISRRISPKAFLYVFFFPTCTCWSIVLKQTDTCKNLCRLFWAQERVQCRAAPRLLFWRCQAFSGIYCSLPKKSRRCQWFPAHNSTHSSAMFRFNCESSPPIGIQHIHDKRYILHTVDLEPLYKYALCIVNHAHFLHRHAHNIELATSLSNRPDPWLSHAHSEVAAISSQTLRSSKSCLCFLFCFSFFFYAL